MVLGVLIVLGFVYWWYDLRGGLVFRFEFGACCWFDMVCFGLIVVIWVVVMWVMLI